MKKAYTLMLVIVFIIVQSIWPIWANKAGESGYITEQSDPQLQAKYELSRSENLRLRNEILRLNLRLNKDSAQKIPVLMYHHLLKREDIANGWDGNNSVLAVEVFEEQMDYLYNNDFYIASLDELKDYMDGKIELPQKTVVITFDDGYLSNIIYAYPIMKKYNFRGTIFMIGSLAAKPQQEFNPTGLQYVSIDEAFKYEDVFGYGSHTYNMHKLNDKNIPLLLSSNKKHIMEDLDKSKTVLNCKHFAYPYGRFNNNSIKYLKNAGYELAFTTKQGYVSKGLDKHQLPRFGMHFGIGLDKFESIVNGLSK